MLKYKNGEPYPMEQFQRDLKATAPARVAVIIYSEEYEEYDKGVMSFWDQLDNWQKGVAISHAGMIVNSPMVEEE